MQQFQFISGYQGEFDYRGFRDGLRYRVRANQGNRLTVDMREPTQEERDTFRAWQLARHAETMATFRANPVKYDPAFYEVTEAPALLVAESSNV